MIKVIIRSCKQLIGRVKLHIKQWTKPVTTGLVTSILSDTTRSRVDLIAENALLRQQLIVLRRQVKRPQQTTGDRVRLVLAGRKSGPVKSPTDILISCQHFHCPVSGLDHQLY